MFHSSSEQEVNNSSHLLSFSSNPSGSFALHLASQQQTCSIKQKLESIEELYRSIQEHNQTNLGSSMYKEQLKDIITSIRGRNVSLARLLNQDNTYHTLDMQPIRYSGKIQDYSLEAYQNWSRQTQDKNKLYINTVKRIAQKLGSIKSHFYRANSQPNSQQHPNDNASTLRYNYSEQKGQVQSNRANSVLSHKLPEISLVRQGLCQSETSSTQMNVLIKKINKQQELGLVKGQCQINGQEKKQAQRLAFENLQLLDYLTALQGKLSHQRKPTQDVEQNQAREKQSYVDKEAVQFNFIRRVSIANKNKGSVISNNKIQKQASKVNAAKYSNRNISFGQLFSNSAHSRDQTQGQIPADSRIQIQVNQSDENQMSVIKQKYQFAKTNRETGSFSKKTEKLQSCRPKVSPHFITEQSQSQMKGSSNSTSKAHIDHHVVFRIEALNICQKPIMIRKKDYVAHCQATKPIYSLNQSQQCIQKKTRNFSRQFLARTQSEVSLISYTPSDNRNSELFGSEMNPLKSQFGEMAVSKTYMQNSSYPLLVNKKKFQNVQYQQQVFKYLDRRIQVISTNRPRVSSGSRNKRGIGVSLKTNCQSTSML